MKNQLIIISVLVILLALAAGGFFYTQLKQEQEKIDLLREEIDGVALERDAIISKLKQINTDKELLDQQLQESSYEVQTHQSELLEERSIYEKEEKQLVAVKDKASTLSSELSELTKQESSLTSDLNQVKREYDSLLAKLQSLRDEKNSLEDKVKTRISPKEGVELKKIVVRISPPVQGKIIEVNREFDFAVINLGERDDMQEGDIIGIYRNNSLIAKAVLENTYKEMSSITVFSEWSDANLYNGDIVKVLNP